MHPCSCAKQHQPCMQDIFSHLIGSLAAHMQDALAPGQLGTAQWPLASELDTLTRLLRFLTITSDKLTTTFIYHLFHLHHTCYLSLIRGAFLHSFLLIFSKPKTQLISTTSPTTYITANPTSCSQRPPLSSPSSPSLRASLPLLLQHAFSQQSSKMRPSHNMKRTCDRELTNVQHLREPGRHQEHLLQRVR
jgi:hypothetical protein